MIVRSERPASNFTIIGNETLNDERLSWKARGLLVYLLSKPDHWRTNIEYLASQSPDGIHSVRSGMKELEDVGYITRRKTQDRNGQWSTTTTVFDTPQPVDNPVDKPDSYPQPKSGFPTSGNRTA